MGSQIRTKQREDNYRLTMLLTATICKLAMHNARSGEVIPTKIQPDGTRSMLQGARATQLYLCMEKLGYKRDKVKSVLDAACTKTKVLCRDMAVLRLACSDGKERSTPEYVYNLADEDELDRLVRNSA